jgi:hypothetical protein
MRSAIWAIPVQLNPLVRDGDPDAVKRSLQLPLPGTIAPNMFDWSAILSIAARNGRIIRPHPVLVEVFVNRGVFGRVKMFLSLCKGCGK